MHSNKVPQRKIGQDNISAIGLGLMGMGAFYTDREDPARAERKYLEIMTQAADLGQTFWDTSDIYGPFTNEELVGKWFKMTGRRKEIFLATKFGLSFDTETKSTKVRGDREYVKSCIEGSLKRLGTDYVDLYYQHRVDQTVRIEETVEAMAELIKEGKVRYLGLSECSERTLRRAHKVHPIAAVQMDYSLFNLEIERDEIGIKKTCDELGIAIVAHSPLGRGILTRQYKSRSDFQPDDWRLKQPRFSEENFSKNIDLVDWVVELATNKGCTPGQLVVAWLLKQGENVIPVPGTRQVKYLENWGALKVDLSEDELKKMREMTEKAEAKEEKYDHLMINFAFADAKE